MKCCGKTNTLFLSLLGLFLGLEAYAQALAFSVPSRAEETALETSQSVPQSSFHASFLKPRIAPYEIKRFYGALRKKISLSRKGRPMKPASFYTQIYIPMQNPAAGPKEQNPSWRVDVEIFL